MTFYGVETASESSLPLQANTRVKTQGVSGAFLQSLQDQMSAWLTAINDSKITASEVSGIDGLLGNGSNNIAAASSADGSTVEDTTLFEGPAATLYASTEINKISNVVTWMFNFISMQNDMYDKASNMMTG